jgi:DUF1680 family protein
MRTIASLGAYVATHTADGIQIHQYLTSTVDTDGRSLRMETRYPVDGTVTLTVTATGEDPWTLSLRIPSWCRGATVTVNGNRWDSSEIARRWRPGDVVVLDLPMPVRFTLGHPAVDATRGCVAIERGPVVYCLESIDQPDGVDLNRVEVRTDHAATAEPATDLLGRPSVVVHADGILRDDAAWSSSGWLPLDEAPPANGDPVRLTAIPYALWANRGPSAMRIFIPIHHE